MSMDDSIAETPAAESAARPMASMRPLSLTSPPASMLMLAPAMEVPAAP